MLHQQSGIISDLPLNLGLDYYQLLAYSRQSAHETPRKGRTCKKSFSENDYDAFSIPPSFEICISRQGKSVVFLLERRTAHSVKVIKEAARIVSDCFLSFNHGTLSLSAGHYSSILELLFRSSINKRN